MGSLNEGIFYYCLLEQKQNSKLAVVFADDDANGDDFVEAGWQFAAAYVAGYSAIVDSEK